MNECVNCYFRSADDDGEYCSVCRLTIDKHGDSNA
jgi:hypothetical protein